MGRQPDQQIDSVIERLLANPPQDSEDVRNALDDELIESVRAGLVERIVEGNISEPRAATAAHLLASLGTGEHRQELVQVVQSPFADGTEARQCARLAAFAALALENDREPRELAAELGLDEDEASEMAFRVFEATLDFDDLGAGLVEAYAEALLDELPGRREPLFRELDRRRQRSGLEAGLLYRPLVEDEEYRPLWRLLIGAIESDGNPRDAAWLQSRADEVEDADLSGRMRRVAMKLRTRGLDEKPSSLEGLAWMGNCDGSADATIFLFLDRNDANSYAGINAILALGPGQLVDGFHTTVHPAEMGGFREDIERDGLVQLADVPPKVAVGLLQSNVEEAAAGEGVLDDEIELVRRRIERFPDWTDALPDVEPAESVDPEMLEILRVAPIFESWLFSVDQLRDAGVELSELSMPPETWVREAISALSGTPEIVRQLGAMSDYMAIWAHYGAESGYDRQFARLAEEVREDFESARLTEIMMRRTWQMVSHRQSSEAAEWLEGLGDEDLRSRLADRHLSDEEEESIREEAIDYMELAFHAIEEGWEELPGRGDIDFDLIEKLAGRIGRPLAELFCGRSELPPAATFEHVASKMSAAGFDRHELEVLVPSLLTQADLLADRRGDVGFGPLR